MEDWRYREQYELEDRHWWFRGRRVVMWSLLRRAGIPDAPRILDAGCGTGRNLAEFSALGPAEGIDSSEEAVAFCKKRGFAGVRHAGLEDLPFEDARFNLLLATDVLEHLDDDGVALDELRRVSASGARLLITVPAYMWLWNRHDVSFHHRRRYTTRRLLTRVTAHGWEPIVRTYFFSAMLPAVAAVRTTHGLRKRHQDIEHRGSSDLALSPAALNRILVLPSRVEATLIERGVTLPAGVSVGMVCTPR